LLLAAVLVGQVLMLMVLVQVLVVAALADY
jgi:hypothetical protein